MKDRVEVFKAGKAGAYVGENGKISGASLEFD
jgi:hypothetical protein